MELKLYKVVTQVLMKVLKQVTDGTVDLCHVTNYQQIDFNTVNASQKNHWKAKVQTTRHG